MRLLLKFLRWIFGMFLEIIINIIARVFSECNGDSSRFHLFRSNCHLSFAYAKQPNNRPHKANNDDNYYYVTVCVGNSHCQTAYNNKEAKKPFLLLNWNCSFRLCQTVTSTDYVKAYSIIRLFWFRNLPDPFVRSPQCSKIITSKATSSYIQFRSWQLNLHIFRFESHNFTECVGLHAFAILTQLLMQ